MTTSATGAADAGAAPARIAASVRIAPDIDRVAIICGAILTGPAVARQPRNRPAGGYTRADVSRARALRAAPAARAGWDGGDLPGAAPRRRDREAARGEAAPRRAHRRCALPRAVR